MVPAGPASAEKELTVSAAASLANAFPEIGKKFEAANPGVKVLFNFAASGSLLQQIEKGAPVDVFASADQKTMDRAGEKSLIAPKTRQNFAGNRLVLVLPADSKLSVSGLAGLAKPEVARISLGTPEAVPAGAYTKEALVAAGLWESLAPKYIYAENVRQALDYVGRGEVDAGFVFATDAAAAKAKVKVAATVENTSPVLYPIAVVANAQNKDLGQKFIDLVRGEEGRRVLASFGFTGP
jgi:molybdate transport system substrate-binding protein